MKRLTHKAEVTGAMAAEEKYLAFDLGAESGRALVGFFDGERVRLEDVHRFQSRSVRLLNTLHWDALNLFSELKRGLAMAASTHGKDFAGLGIDTWGVDFGLLGKDDSLLGNPRHYRDHGNDGILDVAFGIVGREEIFASTGIQFMQFNSLFQLLALKRAGAPVFENARTLLMMPDLLNFWFTGQKVTEYSIASTTQMIGAAGREWDKDLISKFGIDSGMLTDIVQPGVVIGSVRDDIAEEAGCGKIPVVLPAEHDTASAVAAVPARGSDHAYISSGTWSLMGVELTEPRINADTEEANFTNEGGACGTIRLLKNIMGLWLVQECRRAWSREGAEHSYAQLTEAAVLAQPFSSLIDPDSGSFLAPADMPREIREYCRRSGQPEPQDMGATVRTCLESLALKYRWTLEKLETFRGKRIDTIHIVGGGTQNRLLCQLAADATNRPVIAGPVEATAIGNVLMQAIGRGRIEGLDQAREIVRGSFALDQYEPSANRTAWDDAYARFTALQQRAL